MTSTKSTSKAVTDSDSATMTTSTLATIHAATTGTTNGNPPTLLTLPWEVRQRIFAMISSANIVLRHGCGVEYMINPKPDNLDPITAVALSATCRQLREDHVKGFYTEGFFFFRSWTTLVRFGTRWPHAAAKLRKVIVALQRPVWLAPYGQKVILRWPREIEDYFPLPTCLNTEIELHLIDAKAMLSMHPNSVAESTSDKYSPLSLVGLVRPTIFERDGYIVQVHEAYKLHWLRVLPRFRRFGGMTYGSRDTYKHSYIPLDRIKTGVLVGHTNEVPNEVDYWEIAQPGTSVVDTSVSEGS